MFVSTPVCDIKTPPFNGTYTFGGDPEANREVLRCINQLRPPPIPHELSLAMLPNTVLPMSPLSLPMLPMSPLSLPLLPISPLALPNTVLPVVMPELFLHCDEVLTPLASRQTEVQCCCKDFIAILKELNQDPTYCRCG